MSRADLLALTPASVAALANVGLVKRAQREIEAGKGPLLEEDATGTVVGRFDDGVETTVPEGVPLRDAPCSCGAATVCRHRVAVVLAYPGWHATQPSSATPEGASQPSVPAVWSPACFADDALAKLVGKRLFERARAIVRAGVVVELVGGTTPSAKLPTCSVRFHVPQDLAYARCDCKAVIACEHVVVAAWAFRHAAEQRLEVPCTTELCPTLPGTFPKGVDAPLADVRRLVEHVLTEGVTHLGEADRPRFARVRASLATASGTVWLTAIVDDIEIAIEAYRARSTRYRTADVAHLIASLAARDRAADRGTCELPRRFLFGDDEAKETPLDHVRLVALGARIDADDRARTAEVFLADPDSGVVLVARKRFTYTNDDAPEDGVDLARRAITGRITLGALAHGQLVTRAAKRHANHTLTLATSRTAQTSVAPSSGDWGQLPDGLLVHNFAALAEDLRAAPPRLLRPRTLASRMRVLAIPKGQVLSIAYRPGEQELVADLGDGQGGRVRLVRRYARATPHALDVLASALDGEPGPRFVAGDVYVTPNGVEIEPTALVSDRILVPDLERATSRLDALPTLGPRPTTPMMLALETARAVMEEALHNGLAHLRPGFAESATRAADACSNVGLVSVETRIRALANSTEPRAWLDAVIRLELTEEASLAGLPALL
jgi:hypothetical protein